MDIIDRANEVAEVAVAAKISEASAAELEVSATGRCLNCGVAVPEGRRWCDADCRDDWQARSHRR